MVSGMNGTITQTAVDVNITHTFIGDLVIWVRHPDGTQNTLHNRSGGSTHNLVTTYYPTAFNGKSPNGVWILYVQDAAGADIGTLNRWRLTITTRR